MEKYNNLREQAGVGADAESAVTSFMAAQDLPKVKISDIISGLGVSINKSTINQKRTGYVHRAIDIVAKVGTPVKSPGSGIVVAAKPNNGAAGNMLTILYPETRIQLTFMHLNKILVVHNQSVSFGMVVGESGNTGRSTGPHLHLEAKRDGVKLDPTQIFVQDIKITA